MRQPWWSTEWAHIAAIVIFAVLGGQAVRYFGVWWVVAFVALMVAFAAGWEAAYKFWRRRGYVPKL